MAPNECYLAFWDMQVNDLMEIIAYGWVIARRLPLGGLINHNERKNHIRLLMLLVDSS